MSETRRPETLNALLSCAYDCLASLGVAKTTIAAVAQASSVSRATIYRYFPEGREQLLREVVAWEHQRFFLRLYEAVSDAETLEEVIERGLLVAHRAIAEHEVLQLVLAAEPDTLAVVLADESASTRELVAEFLRPYLERHALVDGCDPEKAASFLARMVLSYMAAQGRWNLADPEEVSELVRSELLAGIAP